MVVGRGAATSTGELARDGIGRRFARQGADELKHADRKGSRPRPKRVDAVKQRMVYCEIEAVEILAESVRFGGVW